MKKEELKFKQIGQNVLITIDGKKYVKVEADKGKRDALILKIKAYNKINSKDRKDALIKAFSGVLAKAEKKVALKKGISKLLKKDVKKAKSKTAKKVQKVQDDLVAQLVDKSNGEGLSENELSTLRALLDKNNILKEIQPTPVVTTHQRTGEY